MRLRTKEAQPSLLHDDRSSKDHSQMIKLRYRWRIVYLTEPDKEEWNEQNVHFKRSLVNNETYITNLLVKTTASMMI
jgi:hypothetical protein